MLALIRDRIIEQPSLSSDAVPQFGDISGH